MKIEIEFEEIVGFGRLHQNGFSLESKGKEFLDYCVSLPGFLPYVFVHQGQHAGKIFAANPQQLKAALVSTFLAEPAAAPALNDLEGGDEAAMRQVIEETKPAWRNHGDAAAPAAGGDNPSLSNSQ